MTLCGFGLFQTQTNEQSRHELSRRPTLPAAMGVRGLSSFVGRKGVRRPISWRRAVGGDGGSRFRVIVDGSSLMHSLYAMCEGTLFGGAFDEYHAIVTRFFADFDAVGASVCVVLDGAVPLDKVKTMIARENGKIATVSDTLGRLRLPMAMADVEIASPVRPVLIMHAFRSAVQEARAELIVCDFEADDVIVRLAIDQDAFVLSQDSDFLVHSLPRGVIAIDGLTWSAEGVSGFVATRDDVAAALGIAPSLMPTFACLCGNDYIDGDALGRFHSWAISAFPRNGPRPMSSIAAFVGSFAASGTVGDVLAAVGEAPGGGGPDLTAKIASATSRYAIRESVDVLGGGALSTLLDPTAFDFISIEEFRRGNVPACVALLAGRREFVCFSQLEDTASKSSWAPSAILRRRLYALLLGPNATVAEYVRRGDKTVVESVAADDSVEWWPHGVPLPLSRAVWDSPTLSRLSMFLDVAGLSPTVGTSACEGASDLAVYIAAAVALNAPTCKSEAELFAASALLLFDGDAARTSTGCNLTLRGVQAAAQMQASLVVLDALNWLLGSPLAPFRPAGAFDGATFHAYFGFRNVGEAVRGMATADARLMTSLVQALFYDDAARKGTPAGRKGGAAPANAKAAKKAPVASANMFDVLGSAADG